jgi:hypothetical protein
MVYTPNEALDRTALLKAGQTVIIISAESGRNKTGAYYDVTTTEGKTYRTFSKYLMDDLKELSKNPDFAFADGFAVEVKGHTAEESGNSYMTFETPSKQDIEAILKQFPIEAGKRKGKQKPLDAE